MSVESSRWSELAATSFPDPKSIDLAPLTAGEREALAAAWSDRARFEHASIGSFARFTLTLLGLGAPPELVERSQGAAIDEVRHANVALRVASVFAGAPLGFGKLEVSGAGADASVEDAVIATIIEGCVHETLAAIEVARCAQVARCPTLRAILATIAADESNHSALAWAFVSWALASPGSAPRLHARAGRAFEHAISIAMAPANDRLPPHLPAGYGFLRSGELTTLRRDAIARVVLPAARKLTRARIPIARFGGLSGYPDHRQPERGTF